MELKLRGLKDVWTGFTDRSGVEVYEGDILKVREMTGADSYEDVLMEPVQFVEGCFVCGDYQIRRKAPAFRHGDMSRLPS